MFSVLKPAFGCSFQLPDVMSYQLVVIAYRGLLLMVLFESRLLVVQFGSYIARSNAP